MKDVSDYTESISVRMTAEMKEDLEHLAASLYVKPSQVVRWALIEYFEWLKERGLRKQGKEADND